MVEPVKYKPENVVEAKPGDVIPEKSIVFHEDGHQWMPACEIIASHNVTHYAPAPILDLPPELKEVPFKEAMERIVVGGEELGWLHPSGGDDDVIGLRNGNLAFLYLNRTEPVRNIAGLAKGTFYELDKPAEPQPKTTSLKWWEAIEAVRGTGKWIRYAGLTGDPCGCWAKWNKSGVLVSGLGEEFVVTLEDLDTEWEIVE